MIIILLFSFVLLFALSFFCLKKEIFSPAVILCLVYIVSICCAIYNIGRWDISLHINTALILVVGTILFVAVSIFIDHLYRKKSKLEFVRNVEANSKFFEKHIEVSKFKMISIVVFDIIIIIAMLFYIYSFAAEHTEINSFSNMLNIFRKFSSYQDTDSAFPFVFRQLLKVLQLSGFIFLYVFMRNFVSFPNNLKRDCIYLLPVLFSILQSLMVSERLRILQITAMGVFLYYFFWSKKNNWEKAFDYKFYLHLAMLFIVLMIGFYVVRLFIGRTSTEGLMVYLTRYAGGSIQLFDLFMRDPIPQSSIWGKETFYYLNQNLHQFGFLEDMYVIHLEFRESAGVVLGNVYTAYRRWIADFGVYGAMILQLILAVIYNVWYQKIKVHCNKNMIGEFSLILFSYLIFTLFMHSIDSNFYRIVVCFGFILTTIEMFIIYYFFMYFNEKKVLKYLVDKLHVKKVKL